LEMLSVCVVPTLQLIVNFESCTHENLRLIFFSFFFKIIPSFSLFLLISAPSCPACFFHWSSWVIFRGRLIPAEVKSS
jgi:hypothetical protein